MSETNPVVIVAAKRTPHGDFLGQLQTVSAPELAGYAMKDILTQHPILVEKATDVMMGCVLPAGIGQAPARQAAFYAGLPEHVPAVTINKMCGSGMQAIIFAYEKLFANPDAVIFAGGMENMSQAPYLLPKARSGLKMGRADLLDHMFHDGLEDAYDKGQLMGCFADNTAAEYNISRKEQDAWATQSLQRAHQAQGKGYFDVEVTPVTVTGKKQTIEISKDELPSLDKIDKIPKLKPAFSSDGTVTAANASSIADGAAVVCLMREQTAKQLGLTSIATIRETATHAQAPAWFTTAPIAAIEHCLQKANLSTQDVDYYEINEAFAVVTLAAIQQLQLDPSTVNVFGGACALGHPLGASGARLVVTLLNVLQQQGKTRGLASLCIGGGEATALLLERLNS